MEADLLLWVVRVGQNLFHFYFKDRFQRKEFPHLLKCRAKQIRQWHRLQQFIWLIHR